LWEKFLQVGPNVLAVFVPLFYLFMESLCFLQEYNSF